MSKSNYNPSTDKCSGSDGRLTVRSDGVVDADVTLRGGSGWTPSKLHRELFSDGTMREHLLHALRALSEGRDYTAFVELLDDLGVTALDGLYADLCVKTLRGDDEAMWSLLGVTARLGTGQTSFDLRSGRSDIDHGALPILTAAEVKRPTVAVHMPDEFTSVRREHRVEALEFFADLVDAFDVALVIPAGVRTFLWREHRDVLPACVESACDPRRHCSPSSERVEREVDEARAKLGHSKVRTYLIERLAEESAERMTYSRLADVLPGTNPARSTVRNHVMTLRDAGLVETCEWYGEAAVELTTVGREFARMLEAERGLESTLGDFVNSGVESTGKSSKYSREGPPLEMGEGTAYTDRRTADAAVHVTKLSHNRRAAATGAATEGAITLVDWPEAPADELRTPFWAFDDETLTVAAEYVNPMQYWVCIARALASPFTWRMALTPDRLDGEDGHLSGLLTDDLRLLRNARNLGFLKDRDAEGERYIDVLEASEEELCNMTHRLKDTDLSAGDVNELRSEITRLAQGLAGTIVHLLDLAGIDVVREVRLGEFSRRFSEERRVEDLVKSIGYAVAIQSRIGHFSTYRPLFETREDKRQSAITPDPDAENPHGKLIGSFVIVGQGIPRIEKALRDAIGGNVADLELHEDAPEFDVGVPIKTYLGRETTAKTMREALRPKNLSPTNEAIAIMQALTTTPYDVSEALSKGLAIEKKAPGRDIRVDELRLALSELDPSRIMPNHSPTVSKVVHALLTTDERLTQSELADRAGVSARSIRNNRDALEAVDLIDVTDGLYRLNLSFSDERGRGAVLPTFVTDSLTTAEDVLSEVVEALYGPRVWDSGHPVGDAFFDPGGDLIDAVVAADPSLEPWVETAIALAGEPEPEPDTLRFGKEPKQAPLPTGGNREVAA